MNCEPLDRHSSLVIAIGNPERGDDGIGPLVASILDGSTGVRVIRCEGDVLSCLDAWDEVETLVLIDATAGQWSPGAIRRFDLRARALPSEIALASTHAVGLAEAVELARALGRLPPRIVLFAIQGACFEPGAPMTPRVAASADAVARAVIAELRRCGEPRHAAVG